MLPLLGARFAINLPAIAGVLGLAGEVRLSGEKEQG
jgi:hypothetical protein